MYNIQTLNKISAIGTDIFDKSKYAVSETAENPDAIMVRSAKMHDMQFGDNLLVVVDITAVDGGHIAAVPAQMPPNLADFLINHGLSSFR